MKHYYFSLFALALLSLAACKKEQTPDTPQTPATAEKIDIQARNEFGWKKADKVSIFDSKKNNLFRSQGIGEVAIISGEAIKESVLYGLVPYDETAKLSEGSISASIPTNQTIQAEQLPYLSVAKSDNPEEMQFHLVCAFLKFSLASDASGVSNVKVSSTAGETLAGAVTVSFDSDSPALSASSTQSQVSATAFEGEFKAGANYYVAVLPGTYSEGFTVFYTVNGETYEMALKSEQSVSTGQTLDLGSIQRPLSANEKLLIGTWQVSKWGSRAYDDPTGQHAWISSNKGIPLPDTSVDDQITFLADGSVKIDLGADGKAYNAATENAVDVELTGDETWSLIENGDALTLKLSGNAFPLFLGNWDGLTTDYSVWSLSATEICLEYNIPANEAYFRVYLQPKGMKTSTHTFASPDFGLNGEIDAELGAHEGPAVTKEGFKWNLSVDMGEEFYIWKTWGALQIGAGWSTNTDLHVKSITLSTEDIPGSIKSVSVTTSYSDVDNVKEAELYVKVGGENFGTRKALINDLTTYTFTESQILSGKIEICWNSISEGLSYFVRGVEVVYQE